MSDRECDWSNLNHDILRLIASKVTLKDFTCIADVCSNWKSGLHWSDFGHPQLPWLMLPCPHENGVVGMHQVQCQCRHRRSFSVMENKVYHLNFPESFGKKCVGTSQGWMIMVEDVSPAIFMLNPLTRQRIELPPVTTMLPDIIGFDKEEVGCEYYYKDTFCGVIDRYSLKDIEGFFTLKVILSHDPNEEDCVAVAICGQLRQLTFCRIGHHDNKWTPVQDLRIPQSDVVYFKGKFYAVNCNGIVGVFDVKNPQLTIIHEAPSGIKESDTMYLAVDTSGQLLHISRSKDYYETDDDDDEDENGDNDGNNDEDDVNDNVNHEDDQEEDGDEDYNVDDKDPKYFYRTRTFHVYKLDEKNNVWNKVRDMGDNIIFLGDNHSICYLASEFPKCKGNSIYFTDDDWAYGGGLYGGYDVGMFDIEDEEGCGLFTKIPCFKAEESFLTIFPRPVWFIPSIRLLDHEV